MAARRQALAAKLILAGAVTAIAAAATVSTPRPAPARAAQQSLDHPTLRRLITYDPAKIAGQPAPAAKPVPAPQPAPAPAPAPAPQPLTIKRVLPIGPIKFGDFAWDTRGVPAGPLIVTVDLAAQTLSVFRDGYEIGATAILYGTDDKPTPLGSFPILMKDAHHVSSLYGAPMPYTLRLTGDGVAVHGTEVAWGYATHGCIGVPTAFAKRLFAEAKVGDRVIITRGKTLATGQALIG